MQLERNAAGEDPLHESVSEWIQKLKQGERSAVDKIWARYFKRIVAFARKRLANPNQQSLDEEDFAIVAFTQFVDGAEKGKFYRLEDRSDLWQILVMITSRRIKNAKRLRGHKGMEVNPITIGEGLQSLDSFLVDPSPTLLDGLNGKCHEMLEDLPERSRDFARKRLMGYTNSEISNWFNVSLSTVERTLATVREKWTQEFLAP